MNGTVRFTVPAVLAEVGPVVEVRDKNLRHVTQAQPGEPIELEAGLYLASVVLPTGGVEQQPVEVIAGSTVEVQLGPHDGGRAVRRRARGRPARRAAAGVVRAPALGR